MIPPFTEAGRLPLGRYPATSEEVQDRFVTSPDFATSATRPEIWAHFEELTTTAQSAFPVAAAWLGGSFLTDKMDPDDLDLLLIIDEKSVRAIDSSDANATTLLRVLSNGVFRQVTKRRLDVYTLVRVPFASPVPPPEALEYLQGRGYWDDFWQRERNGPKGVDLPENALPRRGYLEVILDGFQS